MSPPPRPSPPSSDPLPQPPSAFSPLSRKPHALGLALLNPPQVPSESPFLLTAPPPRSVWVSTQTCVGHVTCGRISVSAKPRSEREPASPKSMFTSVWTSQQLKYLWVFGVCAEPGRITEAPVDPWMEFVTPLLPLSSPPPTPLTLTFVLNPLLML